MPRDRRADLSEFLRARRAALSPADVGLVAGARRRTAGLRREEVALLAGVSVSWYTWLEQGRPINASVEVLDALARALRLDRVEHEHLLALAGHAARGRTVDTDPAVSDDLHALLGALDPVPAYVLGPRWEVLAWNDAQARLYPGFHRLDASELNFVWVVFTEPDARALIGDWEHEARRVLSQFRADITPYRNDPSVIALVDRLRDASAEFAAWWPRHDVARFEERTRRFHHPQAGELRFRYEVLIPASDPSLRLCVHVPIPGDDSVERLRGGDRLDS